MDFQKVFDVVNKLKKEIVLSGKELDTDTYIILCKGTIDTYNSEVILKAIKNIVSVSTYKNIIIDLKGITYISSTGIGMFTVVNGELKPKRELFLLDVNEKNKEIFSLLGFINIFNFISDISEIKKPVKNIFPLAKECPLCKTKFKIVKSGRFHCFSCKEVIEINENGDII